MFRRMIRRSFTAHREFILIRPIIIQATCLERDWHLAQDSYWAQRGRTIGATAIGATATSPLTTTTISIEITSTISIVASKAENGSTMDSIAVARLTGTETRLTSTAAALDNSPLAELIAPAVRQVSAVERVLPEEQAIDPVAEELEISDQVVVPGVGQVPAIVRAAEPDSMPARERGLAPAGAVRVWVLDPVPARALVSGAAEPASVIAVSHRVQALVRAATLLAAPNLAAALHDQPAVEEATAWAAVASAVEGAAVEAAEEAEADADETKSESWSESRANVPT
jgi:hypothetical protein